MKNIKKGVIKIMPNTNVENVNVDPTAESAVVELLANVFNSIAYMDPDTVRHNIELASEGGMSKADRSIRVELANYLLSHFSLIFVGLVVNKEFRDTFKEAVSIEIALDNKDKDFVKQMRQEMKDSNPGESKGNFVLNFGNFNENVYKKMNLKLSDSFSKITEYDETIGELSSELSEDDMIDIGYCASNFMYLVRAFAKNNMFANYVKTVVHNVQETLKIKY